MGIFDKLKNALSNTSLKISKSIENIFVNNKFDEQTLLALEEALIEADVGYKVATKLVSSLKRQHKLSDNNTDIELIKKILANDIADMLIVANKQEFEIIEGTLNVILICGVNGSGKTTTIGKLANLYKQQGKKIAIAACDTFRVAAVEQLQKWANATGALFISDKFASDPASVAYQGIKESIANNIDILFIDTAGRLHNQQNLMDELSKVFKVIKKVNDNFPHYSLLVLDGTTGQNMYNQVEKFASYADINGLIVTKLDGTARAGTIIGVVEKFLLPVYFIGTGEASEDVKLFDNVEFANTLLTIDR